MFHLFHEWGAVKNGYQYCIICNKARILPCVHKWKIIRQVNLTWGGTVTGHVYVQQCENCGKLNDYKVE